MTQTQVPHLVHNYRNSVHSPVDPHLPSCTRCSRVKWRAIDYVVPLFLSNYFFACVLAFFVFI